MRASPVKILRPGFREEQNAMISPWASAVLALIVSWVVFLAIGILTVRSARMGKCVVCKAVETNDQEDGK